MAFFFVLDDGQAIWRAVWRMSDQCDRACVTAPPNLGKRRLLRKHSVYKHPSISSSSDVFKHITKPCRSKQVSCFLTSYHPDAAHAYTEAIWAPSPSTTRGQPTPLSCDPKGEKIAYSVWGMNSVELKNDQYWMLTPHFSRTNPSSSGISTTPLSPANTLDILPRLQSHASLLQASIAHQVMSQAM